MALPTDPFEVTIQILIETDSAELEQLKENHAQVESMMAQVEKRLDGYVAALEGYRKHRPTNPVVQQPPISDVYGNDAEIANELKGLTNSLQRLIKLGLMNNRRVRMNEAGRVLQRTGIMKGKWRNIPARLYTTTKEYPDVFRWISPGEFEILPGAEKYLPESHGESEPISDSLTQTRIRVITNEAEKHGDLIKHNQAVEALEEAGFSQFAKQHAVNALTKSGHFEKVGDGLYRLKSGKEHLPNPRLLLVDSQ
jgi:hypothetical protein